MLPQIITMIIAVAALIYILTVPVGVADGGGQYRFLESMGINYLRAPSAEYFTNQFGVFRAAEARDTHSLILSLVIDNEKDVFNTSTLAVLFGLILLLGLWLAVSAGKRNDKLDWVLAIMSALVFADIGYLAYFNTLYYESTILTMFVLTMSLVFLTYKKNAPIYLILLSAASTLAFAFTGTLQAWVGTIFGCVLVRLCTLNGNKLKRALSVISGMAVISVSLSFALTYKPVDYEKNIFHSVFLGVAKYESVSELGLNPKLDELSGQFYSDGLIERYSLKQEFFDKISYGKITGFYLTHPSAFFGGLNSAVKNAFALRPAYLGNFMEESGMEGEQAKGFSLYSLIKSTFVPNTVVFMMVFFILYFGVLIYLYASEKEKRPLIEIMLGISVSAILCLKLPLILSGEFELGRSLFTFGIFFDLMILLAVVAGGRYMKQRRRLLQEKYGANQ